MVDFGELNNIISDSTGIKVNTNSKFTVEAFNEYNSTISEEEDLNTD